MFKLKIQEKNLQSEKKKKTRNHYIVFRFPAFSDFAASPPSIQGPLIYLFIDLNAFKSLFKCILYGVCLDQHCWYWCWCELLSFLFSLGVNIVKMEK